MTESPDEVILDITKTCQLVDKVQIIPKVEINSPVPDQENNIKNLKRLVENNNDETTENYEEFLHGIQDAKNDMVRKVQKSPANNVTIQENAIKANNTHEIIRGRMQSLFSHPPNFPGLIFPPPFSVGIGNRVLTSERFFTF